MQNEFKRRSREDYVLSDSNKGIITDVNSVVKSVLLVSHQCPEKALQFLLNHGADPQDAFMRQVIEQIKLLTVSR